ncbi:MAG: TRAP transporter TatT component family protein [Desulfobacterales bacterium]|nr:MAG: TRAP transporter TatT component family protein [Desulfobacterales bacterium]
MIFFYNNIRRPSQMPSFALPLLIIFVSKLLVGCSFFISSATLKMTEDLSQTILNNNDLETVEAGAPAYLLMLDSLLHNNPNNKSLLRAAANIHTAYADVFVKDTARAKKMTDKALDYALRALCVHDSDMCLARKKKFQEFENQISKYRSNDVPILFTLGSSWAAWIHSHRNDWNAVAEIARVEAIMQRVVELDEFYQDGSAHVYLGIMASFLPPALGGKLDVGRLHFERALEISGQKNLMTKVVYASQYARLAYDRNLHDRLLYEVLRADPDVPGYVLSNTLAQKKAQELLDSGNDYF